MSNYSNPYLNPFQQPYQNYQLPQMQVVKVNGENGARTFQMGANSSALLLDESGTMVWLCTTDGASYKTVTPYDISPHQVPKEVDYSTLENRISKLEELVNASATNITAIKRKNAKPNDSTDAPAD